MFLVMRLRKWDCISSTCTGFDIPIQVENPDCIGFMEVYKTREQAVKDWGEGVELVELKEKGWIK